MKEEEKTTIENYIYKLNELHAGMEEGINNVQKILKQQQLLISIILKSKEADEFKDFVKQNEEQIENLKNQIKVISERKKVLEEVLDYCETSHFKEVINKLLFALGIFQAK